MSDLCDKHFSRRVALPTTNTGGRPGNLFLGPCSPGCPSFRSLITQRSNAFRDETEALTYYCICHALVENRTPSLGFGLVVARLEWSKSALCGRGDWGPSWGLWNDLPSHETLTSFPGVTWRRGRKLRCDLASHRKKSVTPRCSSKPPPSSWPFWT